MKWLGEGPHYAWRILWNGVSVLGEYETRAEAERALRALRDPNTRLQRWEQTCCEDGDWITTKPRRRDDGPTY